MPLKHTKRVEYIGRRHKKLDDAGGVATFKRHIVYRKKLDEPEEGQKKL